MNSQDLPRPDNSAAERVILLLSDRLRIAAIGLIVTLGLAFAILVAHKPTVSDADLASAKFTRSACDRICGACNPEIAEVLHAHIQSLDEPLDEIAEAFIRSISQGDRVDLFHKMLALDHEEHERLVLLLSSNEKIRKTLNEHIESQKTKWQTFRLPVLNIDLSRNEAAFWLALACTGIHYHFVMKRHYLIQIRRSSGISYLPDPSLLSATDVDYDAFGSRRLKNLAFLTYQLFFWTAPLIMFLFLLCFMTRVGEWDVRDYSRTFAGIILCGVEGGWSIFVQRRDWKELAVRTLFNSTPRK